MPLILQRADGDDDITGASVARFGAGAGQAACRRGDGLIACRQDHAVRVVAAAEAGKSVGVTVNN